MQHKKSEYPHPQPNAVPTSLRALESDYKETDQEDTTVLDNVEKIKYLGITITNDLKWKTCQKYLHKA